MNNVEKPVDIETLKAVMFSRHGGLATAYENAAAHVMSQAVLYWERDKPEIADALKAISKILKAMSCEEREKQHRTGYLT